MKKTLSAVTLLALLASVLFTSCRDVETYAEMKEKENAYIKSFIKDHDINVITEEQFIANDSTTDVDRNEYVYFKNDGLYMQIARKGEGREQRDGENRSYLFRFVEVSVASRDTTCGNLYSAMPDKMTCKRTGDSYSGTFTQGYMLATYSSVPEGWFSMFPYITPGRPNDKGSCVRLIIPDGLGTSTAISSVQAFYYEINIMPEP